MDLAIPSAGSSRVNIGAQTSPKKRVIVKITVRTCREVDADVKVKIKTRLLLNDLVILFPFLLYYYNTGSAHYTSFDNCKHLHHLIIFLKFQA